MKCYLSLFLALSLTFISIGCRAEQATSIQYRLDKKTIKVEKSGAVLIDFPASERGGPLQFVLEADRNKIAYLLDIVCTMSKLDRPKGYTMSTTYCEIEVYGAPAKCKIRITNSERNVSPMMNGLCDEIEYESQLELAQAFEHQMRAEESIQHGELSTAVTEYNHAITSISQYFETYYKNRGEAYEPFFLRAVGIAAEPILCLPSAREKSLRQYGSSFDPQSLEMGTAFQRETWRELSSDVESKRNGNIISLRVLPIGAVVPPATQPTREEP